MKKISLTIALMTVFTSIVFAGGKDKLTLKEKVEKSEVVKVYFNVTEIVDRETEKKMQQTNPKAKTDLRTKIPAEFSSLDIKNNVVNTLNVEMQVSSFKLADASELGKSNNKKTQYLDFSKLPDGVIVVVQVEGDYTRFVDMGNAGEVSNSMQIKANMFFYEITGGVAKKIKVNMGMGANLGTTKTETIKTPKLEGLSFLETKFPVALLLENYTSTMKEYTGDFAKRMLKKHNKVVSKRK